MKHKIVVAICIVAVVGLSVLAVSVRHTQAVQERVRAAKAYASQQYHDQLQKAAVAAEKKRVNDICHQDQTFYDAQSAAYHKANPVRPQCDLKVVE